MEDNKLISIRAMKKNLLVILVLVVVVGGYLVSFYNGFIKLGESIDGQWAQVETQYQRRFDLIPNLVASVQGIMKQETAVFTAIAEARTRYTGAVNVNDKVAAASAVESAFGRLIAVMENYPVLRSSETVLTLMSQLEGTENRVSVERGRFNELVKTYNAKIKSFPANLMAGIFGFNVRAYFEAVEGSSIAPKVNL